MWTLSLEDRLVSFKKDNFKRIDDALMHCLSFFLFNTEEPMGISGISHRYSADNACPEALARRLLWRRSDKVSYVNGKLAIPLTTNTH